MNIKVTMVLVSVALAVPGAALAGLDKLIEKNIQDAIGSSQRVLEHAEQRRAEAGGRGR